MSVSSSDRLEVLETTSTEGTYKMRIDKIASGGGGGGTTDYEDLDNKPSVNSNELIGNKTSSQLGLQDTLVSGTNIKTVNNQSILGSGNIDIEGGGSSQKVWTAVCNTSADTQVKVVTTTTGGFTLEEGNILIVLFYASQNHSSPSLQVDSNNARSIYNGYANCWGSYEPVVFAVDEDGDFEMLGLQATTGLFGKTKLSTAVNSTATNLAATPSAVKQAYDLAGQKQDELVSGTNIKTVNNQTLLGSGNVNIARSASDIEYDQESTVEEILDAKPYTWQVQNMVNAKQDTLVSGTNIKTINNQSLLGSGNIDVSGGGGTTDYADLTNKPSINSVTLSGNKTSADLGLASDAIIGTGSLDTTSQTIIPAINEVNNKTISIVLVSFSNITGSAQWNGRYYKDYDVSGHIPSGGHLLGAFLGSATNGGILSVWRQGDTTIRLINDKSFNGYTQNVYLLVVNY